MMSSADFAAALSAAVTASHIAKQKRSQAIRKFSKCSGSSKVNSRRRLRSHCSPTPIVTTVSSRSCAPSVCSKESAYELALEAATLANDHNVHRISCKSVISRTVARLSSKFVSHKHSRADGSTQQDAVVWRKHDYLTPQQLRPLEQPSVTNSTPGINMLQRKLAIAGRSCIRNPARTYHDAKTAGIDHIVAVHESHDLLGLSDQ